MLISRSLNSSQLDVEVKARYHLNNWRHYNKNTTCESSVGSDRIWTVWHCFTCSLYDKIWVWGVSVGCSLEVKISLVHGEAVGSNPTIHFSDTSLVPSHIPVMHVRLVGHTSGFL